MPLLSLPLQCIINVLNQSFFNFTLTYQPICLVFPTLVCLCILPHWRVIMLHTAFAFLLLGHAKQIPKQFFVATTQTWSNFSFYRIFLSTDTWTLSYLEKQQSTAQPLSLFWNVFVKWYHLYMLWIARTFFKAWDMSMMMGFWIFKHGMHTSVHWVSCLSNVTFRWRNLPDNWHESTWVSLMFEFDITVVVE
jgi:hypothetical protein